MGATIWAGVLGAELCAPLLLLCWLCCWPDHSSDTSSDNGKHPRKPIVQNESNYRRRSGESLCRRIGSSAASLHLPSTSGHKTPLSAHRSHEDIPKRTSISVPDERYHSAPSVIDEILHRRDWERSSKDLYIPLKPPEDFIKVVDQNASDDSSPEAPFAEQESSSIEMLRSKERLTNITCKKHYTNIKRSRTKVNKESNQDLDKDTDASEMNNDRTNPDIKVTNYQGPINSKEVDGIITSVYKEKESKQSMNESIKSMDNPEKIALKRLCGSDIERRYQAQITDIDLDSPECSGAEPASPDSRGSLFTCVSRMELPGVESVEWSRPRTQSDGDVIARARRPTSGAFSESDLELEIEGASDERPPSYEELTSKHIGYAKETAI